jgi:hypothetical protein
LFDRFVCSFVNRALLFSHSCQGRAFLKFRGCAGGTPKIAWLEPRNAPSQILWNFPEFSMMLDAAITLRSALAMYFMFGDEADREQGRGQKFFVYGAIFVPTDNIPALHDQIEKARKAAGLINVDSLKFASSTRPKAMTFEAHRELKKTIMTLAREVGNVKFCAQVTLHELARNQEHDDLVLWGANTVLGKFNMFLGETKSHGYAVLDKIPVEHPYRYLKEKFQVGLTFQGKPSIRLDRILGFGHAVDGSSHMCSVADVMLGAFRYCVNEPDNEEAGNAMFPVLMSMMWKREREGKTYVNECGLVFRPANIKEAKHQAEYDVLIERLQSYIT